jgi:signal transduction histidine kinase
LEKSNSELDQFAYVASHDLKSPLNAIARLSSWIEEDCAELLPDKSREYLNLLHGRVNRLTHLLDDLLVYSRVGRRDHEFNYVNIKKVSEELLDLNAPDKPFSLTATEMKVFVPTVPFELVLRNLISNTIKHHDKEQGIIDVKAEVNEMGYEVRVSDNGPGIPAEFRQKAVQMFQTLQSRDETEGSGMGLAICKKTVEYYGGEFFIEDSPLGGTTIIMMWPIGQGSSLRGRKHEQGNHPLTH